jgi:hypothetical protein
MPPVAYLGTYSIAVATQPTGETCTVTHGSGTMGPAAVTNVLITCSINSYTLGGVISGLGTFTGLVLSDGTDQIHVAANATQFSMPTGVAYGSPYTVTVIAQPPGVTCTISGGSGTMPGANVNTVQVTCNPFVWAWEAGAQVAGGSGSYPGSTGTSGTSYIPSARNSQMSWKTSDGKLWLYGGTPDSATPADINDVWSYDPASQKWTWVSGSAMTSTTLAANWGTVNTPAPTNTPGARHGGAVWVDPATGLVWLFGGQDAANNVYNDLWTYNTTTGVWTWVGGTQMANNPAVGPPTFVPRSRAGAATWVDKTGKFWLFGGLAAVGSPPVFLTDLWTFDPGTQQWTLVVGDAVGTANTNGAYPSAYGQTGTPSARAGATAWVDGTGTLWLFGGAGDDSSATDSWSALNDLWSYNTSAGQWTWVGGSKYNTSASGGAVAQYGTQGTGSATNIPGGRGGAAGWVDNVGRFWLFGGADIVVGHAFDDLWSFDPTTGQWTFVKGTQGPSTAAGQYGTLQVGASSNQPGAHYLSSAWADSSGHLWLFGGSGYDGTTPTPTLGNLNDLWEF